MRRAHIAIAVAAALTVGGCITDGTTGGWSEASDLVKKGGKIADDGVKKLAEGFDGYCSLPTPAISQAARTFVRSRINAALAAMGSKYRAADFCQPAP